MLHTMEPEPESRSADRQGSSMAEDLGRGMMLEGHRDVLPSFLRVTGQVLSRAGI